MSRYGATGPDDATARPPVDPDATTVRPVLPGAAPRRNDEATLPPPGGAFAPARAGDPGPAGAVSEDDADTLPRPRREAVIDRVPAPTDGIAPADGTVLQPRRRWVSGQDVQAPTARPDLYRDLAGPAEEAYAPAPTRRSYAESPPAYPHGSSPRPEPQAVDLQPQPAPVPRGAMPATARSASEPQRATRPAARRTAGRTRRGRSGSTAARRRPGRKDEKKPTTLLGAVLELGAIVAIALVLSFLLRTFIVQPFEVPSGSMENTLRVGDKIAAQKLVGVERGDVVVFRDVNHWLPADDKTPTSPARRFFEVIGLAPDSAQEHLVKRVIGMPGDRVSCCDKQGRLSINGVPLDEGAYLYSDASGMVKASNFDFEVVVPAGHIFVMGDHRDASNDARCFLRATSVKGAGGAAFIPLDAVVGTVPAIFLPFDRVRRLDNPAAFRAVPPPQQAPPAQGVVVRAPDRC